MLPDSSSLYMNIFQDLNPATQYQIRVCAINSAGCSPYSCNVSMETPSTPPSAPHTLTHTQSTASSISFKWKRPADNGDRISGYHVEWSGPNKEVRSEQVAVRKLTLDNLKPDTTYTLRVQGRINIIILT